MAWPSHAISGNSAAQGITSRTIDALDEKIGYVVRMPKAGTIARVGFRTGAVTQEPADGLLVTIQGVDASGNPDGNVVAQRLVTGADIAVNTWITTGLLTDDGTDTGVPVSFDKGEVFAVVVDFASFDAGDAMQIAVLTGVWQPHNGSSASPPYSLLFTTAWGTRTQATTILGVQITEDDEWLAIVGAVPAGTVAGTAYSASSTPDECGMKFNVPVPMRTIGATGCFNIQNTNSTYKVHLYKEVGGITTELARLTVDPDVVEDANAPACTYAYWSDSEGAGSVELDPAVTYRLTWEATGTGSINRMVVTPGLQEMRTAMPWGTSAVFTSRSNGGVWSDDSTTGIQMGIGLLIDAIDPVKGDDRRGRGILRNICNFMRSFLR